MPAMTGSLSAGVRTVLLGASRNRFLRRSAAKYGMRLGAARFVAGRSLEQFVPIARELNARGFAIATAILGEGIASRSEAAGVTAAYGDVLDRIAAEGLNANVALKLTHLGLNVDPEIAFTNLQGLLERAGRTANRIRIDMEESAYVDVTLQTYERLRAAGFDNVGVVLQAYLYRSADDLERLSSLKPNVRLVKGAYLEPQSVAFPRKADVDANYLNLIECALAANGYTAIATHDEAIIVAAKAMAERLRLPRSGRFEFQMLYGIRPDLQRRLVGEGYVVRIAAPFGPDWFPYFMRRLAERPENLGFVLRNLT
jgi:proline dehydrogenase